ncbi:hypothetical protein ACHAPU_001812 [Fusarium lateritium]
MLSSLRRAFSGKPDQPVTPYEEPSTSPSVQRQPTRSYSGIQVLHSSDHDEFDIVFVHGLKGDCLGTWKDRSTNEPWPKSLLPQVIEEARILTYSYDATVTGKGSLPSQNRISNHAAILLSALATLRQSDDTDRRPIIFVCHSLGGLVCQDALVLATQSPEQHLEDIANFARGIVFLGTPHYGSSLAEIGELVSRSFNTLRETNSDIVRVLTPDSAILARIQDSFHALLRTRRQDESSMIEITCFFEELPTKRLGLVVPKYSAILPGYTSIGIHRNHAEMTKFSHPDEPGFKAICGELKRWMKRVQRIKGKPQMKKDVPVTHYLVPYTYNPDFVGRLGILELLKLRLGHAGTVSQSRAHLRATLYGLGGIGYVQQLFSMDDLTNPGRKTQIALAYSSWLQEAFKDISVFWVHASSAERFLEAYTNIAKECKVPGHEDPDFDPLSETKAWLESEESGQWLMIVDNANDMQLIFPQTDNTSKPTYVKSDSLGQFIPECPHGAILITTRNMQVGSRLMRGKRPMKVGNMDEQESTQLLRQGLKREDDSPKDLLQLSSRLEFLPLALVQAAAFIQENSITVTDYLGLLDGSEDDLVDLLNEEFEAVGRDSGSPRAVAQTWMISFQQIERQYPFASELLSLMSSFDRQAIPLEFLEFYAHEKKGAESNITQLVKALGVLKAFCFIRAERGGDHNMHCIVQLVTRTWLLKKGTMTSYVRDAMLAVSDFFPYGCFEEAAACTAYLAHAFSVLGLQNVESDEDNLLRASILHRIGGFFLFQGRYAEAERVQREGIKIRTELLGEDHAETLILVSDLSASLERQGRWGEAENLGVAVVETRKRLYGEESHQTLDAMSILALNLYEQDRIDEAKQLYTHIFEVRKRVLGDEHPDTIRAMSDLAKTLGDGEEGEKMHRHVLEAKVKADGADHPETLSSKGNLAVVLYKRGKAREAEELQVEVMEVSERVLGEEHPDTLLSMMHLAKSWMFLGKEKADSRHLYPDVDMFGGAEKLLQKCVRLRTQLLGPDHPSTLESMLRLEEYQDAIERADRLEVNAEAFRHNSQA